MKFDTSSNLPLFVGRSASPVATSLQPGDLVTLRQGGEKVFAKVETISGCEIKCRVTNSNGISGLTDGTPIQIKLENIFGVSR